MLLCFLGCDPAVDHIYQRLAAAAKEFGQQDAGVQNIESKFYPGARHELLVETNHQEVFEDIGSWMEKQLA